MPKVIVKAGYVKGGGGAGGYMKYIAERKNAEKLEGNGPASEKQQQLIADLVRDFPDTKELHEYADYTASPTFGNASAFITMALDSNAGTAQGHEGYMRYIALRPRAERHGDHGLFGEAPSVSLCNALKELGSHNGNVWTLIYSLRREDAERLGFNNAESWRQLIMAHKLDIAKALRIPPSQLHWYAAFHNEGHHPHVHMMAWADDPKQGFLTTTGIEIMRSKLTNEIFRDELHELYQEKDISYKELRDKAQSTMQSLVQKMSEGVYDNPSVEQKMNELANALKTTTGKKAYKYLKKPVKARVDAIVDELAAMPEVAECYEVWNKLKDDLDSYYHESSREHKPLSQQAEFRAIKNMVIREAENISLGVMTFEDEGMDDELEEEIREKMNTDETFSTEMWLKNRAAANHQYAYCLGKLLEGRGRIDEAVEKYEQAAARGSDEARYRLGKMCLMGEVMPKNVVQAIEYLTASAQRGNQYAQYALGKLYLIGSDVEQDCELARYWLAQSAAQGNPYAQFFLERLDEQRSPPVMLSVTRLLHHMANFFRDNYTPPTNPHGARMDSKRRRKLMRKRLALGHKLDDHEEPERKQQYGQIIR